MDVKIKLVPGGKMPEYKTAGAACADCYARVQTIIPAGERRLVPLGVCLELPEGYEAVVRPRSGMSKNGVDVAIGTVDEDFKGEIMANIINNMKDGLVVEEGTRVCQLKIQRAEQFNFVEVDELSETKRGVNGWGSTGVK